MRKKSCKKYSYNSNIVYRAAILLYIVLFGNYGFVNYNYPPEESILGKQQMYEDYDFLCKIILSSYPYRELKKEIMDYFIDSALIRNRDEIVAISSTEEFVSFINKSVNLLHDGHASIIAPGFLKYYTTEYSKYCNQIGINEEALKLSPAYYAMANDSIFKKIKLGLRFKYLDGVYYNLRPFVYGADTIETGAKLESINGQPAGDYVFYNHESIPNCRWDSKNGTFYSDFFYLSPNFVGSNQVQLQFNTGNGSRITINVNPKDTLHVLKKETTEDTSFKIEYLATIGALYIKMLQMREMESHFRQIKENLLDSTQYIILDARGNRGGNDKVWKGLLSYLSNDTIIYRKKIFAKESCFNEKYIRLQMPDVNVDTLPLFPNKSFFRIYDGYDSIFPAQNSLKFKGKIIVLGDDNTFSSAQSLMALAKSEENIISIGLPTGRVGGFGITPPVFMLPNSKIVFSMPITLDYSNIKSIKDLLHDSPEYIVDLSFMEYSNLFFGNQQDDKDSFNDNDPYFKLINKILKNSE